MFSTDGVRDRRETLTTGDQLTVLMDMFRGLNLKTLVWGWLNNDFSHFRSRLRNFAPSCVLGEAKPMALQITPLYGSFAPTLNSPAPSPSATLVKFAGVTVLIDCGWAPPYDPSLLINLKAAAPAVDLILITSSSPNSTAALPYARKHFSLSAPIYTTGPTFKMGQVALYELFNNEAADGKAQALNYNLNDIDAVFSLVGPLSDDSESNHNSTQGSKKQVRLPSPVKLLKYSEALDITIGKTTALTISSHRSGVTVGGSYWLFERKSDESRVVFVQQCNRSKERHLNGVDLREYGTGADMMIWRANTSKSFSLSSIDSKESMFTAGLQKRESELVKAIMGAMRQGGNVLIPVDASGRVLEVSQRAKRAVSEASSERSEQ